MDENTSVNMQEVAEPAAPGFAPQRMPEPTAAQQRLLGDGWAAFGAETDTQTQAAREAAGSAAETPQGEVESAEDVGTDTQHTTESANGELQQTGGESSAGEADEPSRDYEKDAAYAKIRREADEARREAKKLRAALKTLDFEGDSADDIADRAQAYRTGRPIEEIRAERVERERLEQLEQENRELRGRENERIFRDDMAKIREAFPDVKAKSVEELGVDFIRMRAMGIDPLVAYEAMRSAQSRTQKSKPPSTGSAKSAGKAEGGLFTREEVKSMSPGEVRKNFDKIRKSMSNWR